MRAAPIYVCVGAFALSLTLLSQVTQGSRASAAQAATAPAMQLPADQRAYKAAMGLKDKEQRRIALQQFLKNYQSSKNADAVRENLLKLLLEGPSIDIKQVHTLAQTLVDQAGPEARPDRENSIAYALAEAAPDGIDLHAAEMWARDAVEQQTLLSMTSTVTKEYSDSKLPAPTAQDIKEAWASNRANFLQTLADVYVHENKLPEADKTLEEALALSPENGSVWALQGQIAHRRRDDSSALHKLELASAYADSDLTDGQRALLKQLYAGLNPDKVGGLDAEVERIYSGLPQPVTPTAYTGPTSGHTVLVELYSGSGCQPCLAADYAFEGILQSFPRDRVVALTFGLHNPLPDPLANPDSLGRAEFTGAYSAPTVRVDGRPGPSVGGPKARAQRSFEETSKVIKEELKVDSGIDLELSSRLEAAHAITARANVEVKNPVALQRVIRATVEPDVPNMMYASKRHVTIKSTVPEKASRLVLNFALVQQLVRYNGENGFRFHRMVVRALAKPSAVAFPVTLTGSSTASYTFDPVAVGTALGEYLSAFEKHSDKFGTNTFLMKDTTLPLDQLAIAAWVEDAKTHHVIAAAFAPVQASQQAAQ